MLLHKSDKISIQIPKKQFLGKLFLFLNESKDLPHKKNNGLEDEALT